MQVTLASHPLIAVKRASQSAARADREAADWQRYPTPSVEANTQTGGQNGYVFRLDQPLWTGGRITSGISAAGSRLDAATVSIGEARQELALKVVAASAEALRQQARAGHVQAGVREHQKLLDMIKRRVSREVSSESDLLLAESRLFASTNDLSATQQALRSTYTQLSQLTGQPVTALSEQGFVELATPSGLPADLDSAIEMALKQSPVLQRLRFEDEAAHADIESKRSVLMPQVTLRLESSHAEVTDNRAMLFLQAQPGAGLSAGAGIDAAIARRDAGQRASEAAEREVRQQVMLDWNEWENARSRLENAERVRSTSVAVSESYARQYTAGRKSWLDVLNAVREATQSELALADTRSQMQAALLRLKVQTGVLDLASK